AGVEGHAWRPAEQLPGAARIQILVADLARRLVADVWSQVGAAEKTQNALDDLEDGLRLLVGDVDPFTGHVIALSERLGHEHVRVHGVFDVEVIPDEPTIRADHRPLSTERRANRPRHDPAPVQITTAEQVAAAGDGDA